jgi:hypothetical protein
MMNHGTSRLKINNDNGGGLARPSGGIIKRSIGRDTDAIMDPSET